jgi:phosphoribosylpyrophosphate synthetase
MKLKKLKVDIDEIGWYMETQDRFDTEVFLDLETGEIVAVDLELLDRVDNGEPFEELTEWSKEEIKQCEEILFSDTERYVCIPTIDSYEVYRWMQEFANSVNDVLLKEKLAIALDGKGAFRRFKNVLDNYPEYREKWFKFKREKLNKEIVEWLHSIGVEPEDKSGQR